VTLPRWQPGRQCGGYEKLTLFAGTKRLPVDMHLLRYRVGDSIPAHTDPVDGRRHWRLNLVLREAIEGGVFLAYGPKSDFFISHPRLNIFRPDTVSHGVTRIENGERLVLSIGLALPKESFEAQL
jgi:hypothetical protein